MPLINVYREGLKGYQSVLAFQEKLFQQNIQSKEQGLPTANHLIFCEHYPVYTLGKSGKRENILVSNKDMQADFFHVNRGGDVTFHGPGQLVVYPVLDLETFGFGLAEYITRLEETVIKSLQPYGINAQRLAGAPGIWVINHDDKEFAERKICAIGVKASRQITMHGIAVNISTDLSYFDKIVPCGLKGKGVTSLQKETCLSISIQEYEDTFLKAFKEVFKTTEV